MRLFVFALLLANIGLGSVLGANESINDSANETGTIDANEGAIVSTIESTSVGTDATKTAQELPNGPPDQPGNFSRLGPIFRALSLSNIFFSRWYRAQTMRSCPIEP